MEFYIFNFSDTTGWLRAIRLLEFGVFHDEDDTLELGYAQLLRTLVARGAADLPSAIAEDLLCDDSALSRLAMTGEAIPSGLREAAQADLEQLASLVNRDWQGELSRALNESLPKPRELAPLSKDERVVEVATMLERKEAGLLEYLLNSYQHHGTGTLSQYQAFRWLNHALHGIAHPVQTDMARLVGLERPLTLLEKNTSAFLEQKPAQHTLLYGPRGSGKSTAVRSLLKKYSTAGLRLIELSAKDLAALPEVIEVVRFRPHKFIVFVDDLNFETGDNSYTPLKTLLEGSLTARPENVLVYATSNRRHLVKEHFSDRPDPLNDDVHAWDTHNERLALSDRFGLTITFPDATQQRYLEIVRGLITKDKLKVENFEEKAIRFAEWGNGYSGRTAQQFLESLQIES
ncbi:MAG: ATP-binding protein [Trueperaceae bacterium]